MQSKKPNKSSSGDNPKRNVNERIHEALGVKPYKGQKSDNATEVKRFIESLNQAMVMHEISQRKLGDEIGVSIGTVTKYLRGEVNPFDVRSRITRNLATKLGITTEALYNFYDTGEYKDTLTIKDVESWIRSTSESKDLPRILSALSVSQKKLQGEDSPKSKVAVEQNVEPPKPSRSEIIKFGKLLADHFQKIRKYEAINTRETWQLFLKQDYAKSISEEHLDQMQDVLSGEIDLTPEIIKGFGKAYGRCPIYMVFSRMSDVEFSTELKEIHEKVVVWHCFHLKGYIPEKVDALYE